MNLNDGAEEAVAKKTMVSAPRSGARFRTRTFIPHRWHSSIGVLGAVSVATACLLEGSPAAALSRTGEGSGRKPFDGMIFAG